MSDSVRDVYERLYKVYAGKKLSPEEIKNHAKDLVGASAIMGITNRDFLKITVNAIIITLTEAGATHEKIKEFFSVIGNELEFCQTKDSLQDRERSEHSPTLET
jgi:hypothetical protein